MMGLNHHKDLDHELETAASIYRTCELAPEIMRVLRCPETGLPLRRAKGGIEAADGTRYPLGPADQPDLRLRAPKRVPVEIIVGEPISEKLAGEYMSRNSPACSEVDWSRVPRPQRITRDQLSYVPRARKPGALALDLGCAGGTLKQVCETAGYIYVGIDHSHPQAPILADAHSLPCADGAFDLVVSVAVLEHLQCPLIALREVYRVLKPGGTFIGTVAFLEPFHQQSYYHHTHLGIIAGLQRAGLVVRRIAPEKSWNGLVSLACMGLFPRIPAALARAITSPIWLLSRMYWRAGRNFDPTATEYLRRLKLAGSFFFVAEKPTVLGAAMEP